ncbi:tail spike protein [Klebsiella phage K64-1]|uniref:Depolymerase, capsule KN4-specific n=1 Tax=Klebsiella phage K64-1 TaxID=1439894 RepID=DPO12_BPK64|nr:tail protein [Klebsiella phage K64-1]A0A0A8JA02.1 RecName: Full=Depolymerase, capsule KN4-specific; AltName: Full=Probable tail spike protein [Klebsiella phage K64-1]BAQ02835.1 tail spike protein [Klebsiella phage K64-1]BAW85692.1 tail spike protein [Klebsiella phage K64-1]
MTNSLIQPKGSVSKETNIQSIARITGSKIEEVKYLEDGLDIAGLKFVYDSSTETIWKLNGNETGMVDSWNIVDESTIIIVTNISSYQINILEQIILSNDDAAGKIGTSNGLSVQKNLDNISNNITLDTGGVLKDALKFITPEMFVINNEKYIHGTTLDAVPYLQAAIDYGKTNNLPVVLSQRYPCITFPQTYELPRDDGTVYPGWITAGTDQNIDPEPIYTMRAAIRLYNDSVIIGTNMQTTGIRGNWSKTSGPYDLNGTIGVFISGDSGKDGYVRYHMHDLNISGFMIGRLCEGISAFSTEDNLQISSCGITGIFQGEDAVERGFIKLWYNIAGDVFGGQWLTRNYAYASTYLPPYPASDIYRAGWNDSSFTEKYHYYGDTSLNFTHTAYSSLDNFFNTYFFKTANSITTANGGRLSNNKQTGVWPLGEYKGITGRAKTVYSRYGREILNCNILEAKIMWSPRTPFYHTSQSGSWVGNSKIGNVILERVGIINYAAGNTTGNRFNVDNVDPWDPSQNFFPAMVCRGNIGCMDVTRSGHVQQSVSNEINPIVTGGQIHRQYRRSDDTSSYSMLTLQEFKNSWVSKYVFNSSYAFVQPLVFTSSNAQFKYDYGTFTPVLQIAGSYITLTEATGIYHRFGDIIRIHIRLRNSNLTINTAGPFRISGLPFISSSIQTGYTKGSVFTPQATGVTLIPLVTPSTDVLTILKDSAGTSFSHPAGTFDFSFHADFDYVISFNS